MQGTLSTPSNAPASPRGVVTRPADCVYQTVTIAAILLILGSLWVF